jgi:proliferating cell nuclear antigen
MNIQINDNSKCEVFHVIFQNIRLFSENININFKIDAMSIQTMDSSHVSILELNIPNIWFDSYTINKDMVVGINTVLFLKVLSTREKGQSIQIILPIDETDKINIKFESEKSMFNKDFEVPMVDLDTDILAIPEMEYQAEFSLPSSHFYGLVNQLKLFGDCLDILCSEEKITLCSNSVDSGKMMVNIDIDDLTSFAIDEGETLNMSFSLNHLYNMVQFHKISTNMDIFLKSEFPIKICMKLSSDLDAYISMYLAPKISDE